MAPYWIVGINEGGDGGGGGRLWGGGPGAACRKRAPKGRTCITLPSSLRLALHTLFIITSFMFPQPQSIHFNSLPPLMHTILTRTGTAIQTARRALSPSKCKCFYCQRRNGLTTKENWTWKYSQSSLWKERKQGAEAERKCGICLDGTPFKKQEKNNKKQN